GGISIAEKRMVKARVHILLSLIWLFAAGAGAWGLMRYENAPAPTGSTPLQWPSDSRVVHQAGNSTLLMFMHPHCPCSRASVEELNRLLVRGGGRVGVQVFFVRPKGAPNDWTETALWKSAEAIPGIKVQI